MATLASSRMQDDIHPLLRHPKPIKRDFAKAQRMLGLVADNEEHLKRLQREKSVTTRWLERPLCERLDIPDTESEKEEVDSDMKTNLEYDGMKSLGNMEVSITIEPKFAMDLPAIRRRPLPIVFPPSNAYHTQQLFTPERCASPSVISPASQRPRPLSMQPKSPSIEKRRFTANSSYDSLPRTTPSDSWSSTSSQYGTSKRTERAMSFQPQSATSLSGSIVSEPPRRPRPSSFATYSQARNRSNSKIASSRGLRNNSYPNFSRPVSGICPKVVPGEQMEKEMLYPPVIDDTPGLVCPSPPPCPTSRDLEQDTEDKSKTEKKSRNRWSAIPGTFKKLTKRRPSAVACDNPAPDVKIEALRQATVTDENLYFQKKENTQTQPAPEARFLGPALLPTPSNSPLEMQHPLFEAPLPLPFAPWTNIPPSPATSVVKSPVSPVFSTTRNPSRLSVESIPKIRPISMHSLHGSVVSNTSSPSVTTPRRGTPVVERTCILCKTPKLPSDFTTRITANCWHESATCVDCLQEWVETFFDTSGSSRCPCPECGENMTYEDIGAFADVAKL